MKTFIEICKNVRNFSSFKAKRMLNYLVRKELMRHFIEHNIKNTYMTDDL